MRNNKEMIALLVTAGLAAVLLVPSDSRAGSCTVSSCAVGAKVKEKAAEGAEINTSVLTALVKSGVPVTILDARSGKYDDGRRVPGAKSLAADASEELIGKTAGAKDGLIVTYCSNLKCPASRMLASRLSKLGYKNILEYPHGIDGWAAAGNEVLKVNK